VENVVHADWVAKVNAAIKDPARARRVAGQGGKLIDEEQSIVAALKAAAEQLAALKTSQASIDQSAAELGYAEGVTLHVLPRRKLGCGVRKIRRSVG
jgi:hypothetical protein